MSQDPHLPDWAVPGPAPASVVKASDTRRTQERNVIHQQQIRAASITVAELSPSITFMIGGALIPYGLGATIGPNNDKQMFVKTDDGDGGTSSALWQYESGGFVRVGPPTKHASQHNAGGSDAMAVDQAAATGSLRTLGTGAQQAVAGTDSRLPQLAVLTTDMTAINTQTSLQNVTGIGLSIGASATEIWLVKFWIIATAANVNMDIKFGFTVPTGCTMQGGSVAGGTAATTGGWENVGSGVSPTAIATQTNTLALGTAAVTNGYFLSYVVFGGGNAGTVQLQYAQLTSDGGNLQIRKGSNMEAYKLAA